MFLRLRRDCFPLHDFNACNHQLKLSESVAGLWLPPIINKWFEASVYSNGCAATAAGQEVLGAHARLVLLKTSQTLNSAFVSHKLKLIIGIK